MKYLAVIPVFALLTTSCIFHKAPAIPGALPEGAAKLLDQKYPGWQLAEFAPSSGDAACRDHAGKVPTMTSDDLNSDGIGDWVVEIHAADAVKLVIIMGWLNDYRLYEIESMSGDKAERSVASAPRGTKYINPTTKSDDYLSHNSAYTVSCAGDRIYYFWDGDGFQKVVPGPAK
ncbi:MAG TPA: hypothetical protein VLT86_02015 [Vicinamibacterales bacterium]|nr:hypothetical protein [Vicinamibacterales bacterium]